MCLVERQWDSKDPGTGLMLNAFQGNDRWVKTEDRRARWYIDYRVRLDKYPEGRWFHIPEYPCFTLNDAEGNLAELREGGFEEKDISIKVVDFHEMIYLAKKWLNLTGNCIYGYGSWKGLLKFGDHRGF